MHKRNQFHTLFWPLMVGLILAGAALGTRPAGARAQAGSAMDLVNAVNAYRAANGLEPYGVDGALMSQAQAHSEYQASIQDCTHARADGTSPGDHGIAAENIACGPGMSVETAIYSQWTDAVHLATMLGPSTGLVGAGAVVSGDVVYYTLAVQRLSGAFVAPALASAGNESGQAQDAPTQPPAAPGGFATSTPNSDGSIAHVLKYGETLVNIAAAYGITLNDLISINRLDPNNPVYYEGQVLIIRNAFTVTPFVTSTYTPRPPTRTPMPTRTPRPTRTATVFQPPAPSATETGEPLVRLPSMDDLGPARPVLAYAFIGISGLGLLVLLVTAFIPRKKP